MLALSMHKYGCSKNIFKECLFMLRFVVRAVWAVQNESAQCFFSANRDRFRNGGVMRGNRLSCRMSLKSGAGEVYRKGTRSVQRRALPAVREKACATCLFLKDFFFSGMKDTPLYELYNTFFRFRGRVDHEKKAWQGKNNENRLG